MVAGKLHIDNCSRYFILKHYIFYFYFKFFWH